MNLVNILVSAFTAGGVTAVIAAWKNYFGSKS
jgi:hypothetical protein